MIDLDKLDRIYKLTTPGPWRVTQWNDNWQAILRGYGSSKQLVADSMSNHDAPLMVAMHDAYAAIVAELRALRKVRDCARTVILAKENGHVVIELMAAQSLREALEETNDD